MSILTADKTKTEKDRWIHFTLDGKPVKAREGWTVLDTARENGVDIPTLCHHPAVEPSGACRMCVVEAREGSWSRVVVSCMYPPYEGVEILTDSPRVLNVRRWVLEMLLAKTPASTAIRALARQYGVESTRFKIEDPTEECILCGLCVRVCEEVVGVQALSFGGRGTTKHIATPYMIPNTACVACGACLMVCPTGAMQARFDRIRGDVSKRIGPSRTYVGGVR